MVEFYFSTLLKSTVTLPNGIGAGMACVCCKEAETLKICWASFLLRDVESTRRWKLHQPESLRKEEQNRKSRNLEKVVKESLMRLLGTTV